MRPGTRLQTQRQLLRSSLRLVGELRVLVLVLLLLVAVVKAAGTGSMGVPIVSVPIKRYNIDCDSNRLWVVT